MVLLSVYYLIFFKKINISDEIDDHQVSFNLLVFSTIINQEGPTNLHQLTCLFFVIIGG